MPCVAVEVLLGILGLNVVFVIATNQHLICKTVDDVFTDDQGHSHTTPRVLHGPPGKRGQQGVKGEPGVKGDKGLPGLVDPQNVENVIEEKLREANRELHRRIETLERTVTNMNSSINDLVFKLSCTGELYKGTCYFAIIHKTQDVTYQEVQSLCTERGGTPANILNREHEDLIVDYIQRRTSASTYLFLGMTFVPSTSTILWSNGVKVPEDVAASMRWYSGFPVSTSNYNVMILGISSTTIGIYNYYPSHNRHGVVCQM